MEKVICPHCNETQLRTSLPLGEKVRCEVCQRIFTARTPSDHNTRNIEEEDVILEDPAATGERLLKEVRGELDTIPVVDKYKIGPLIGSGGMGKVYEAQDPHLRRQVAIKVMKDSSGDEEKARFLEEAQITGQLEHPNIVPVHDIGFTADGKLFFLMKHVKGRSLEEVVDAIREGDGALRSSFPMPRLLQLLENVCSAVAYAHSRGVIHRDLKPANIMLGDFGEVLVMDLGLAKSGNVRNRPVSPGFRDKNFSHSSLKAKGYRANMKAAFNEQSLEVNLSEAVSIMRRDSNIWGTRRGTVAGTPAYMSPEQARGDLDSLDERSDIYSLGAILYEILTGTPPVLGSTESDIVDAVISGDIQPPNIRSPKSNTPPELSRIAMRALATAPEERYQSVIDFQHDLRNFLDGLTVYRSEDNFFKTAVRLFHHHKILAIFILSITASVLFLIGYNFISAISEVNHLQVKIQKHNFTNQARSLKFIELAKSSINNNQTDAALEVLNIALEYDSNNREARMLRASMYFLVPDYEKAKQDLEILIQRNPADSEAQEKLDDCLKAIKKVETPDPIELPDLDS